MARGVEWILAAVGAITTILVSASFAPSTGGDPWAVLILSVVSLLGFAGFSAALVDEKGRSQGWGIVAWLVAGALSALVFLAGFSFGFFLIPAVLAFLGVALLADRRRGRSSVPHLGVYLAGALGFALIIVLVNLAGWV